MAIDMIRYALDNANRCLTCDAPLFGVTESGFDLAYDIPTTDRQWKLMESTHYRGCGWVRSKGYHNKSRKPTSATGRKRK